MNQKISDYFNKAKIKVKELYNSTTRVQIYAFFSAFCFIFFVLALTFSILFAYKNGELVKTENNALTQKITLTKENKDLKKKTQTLTQKNEQLESGKTLQDAREANKELTDDIIATNNEIKTLTKEWEQAQEAQDDAELERDDAETRNKSAQRALASTTKLINRIRQAKRQAEARTSSERERTKRERAEKERAEQDLDAAEAERDNFRLALKNILEAADIAWNEKQIGRDEIFRIKTKIANLKKAEQQEQDTK